MGAGGLGKRGDRREQHCGERRQRALEKRTREYLRKAERQHFLGELPMMGIRDLHILLGTCHHRRLGPFQLDGAQGGTR